MTMTIAKHNILQTSAALFAAKGFDALTMRDLATACNIKAPSLYNHFKDKKALYQETLGFVFAQHGSQLLACLHTDRPATERLMAFIDMICQQLAQDSIFRQLLIRELVEQDEERARFVVREVMSETCHALHDVFVAINPKCDPHFLTTSLMGLVLFHFQINPLRPYLPSGSHETQATTYLTHHIQAMIMASLGASLIATIGTEHHARNHLPPLR